MNDANSELLDSISDDLRRDVDIDLGITEAAPPQQASKAESRKIDSIMRIPVVIQVIVGSATLPVASLLKLGRGAVVPLDHRIGEPVDVVVNGRTIARGEVVVVEDDNTRFGVSLTEIIEPRIGGQID